MSICDKFELKSKQKMKKMIELSYKNGCEYFTIIKKDFTMGKIYKGEESEFYPNELIDKNRKSVIGLFHTHPYKKDFINDIMNEFSDFINFYEKKEGISVIQKNKLKKIFSNNITKTTMKMSINDLRYSIAKNLTIECIGIIDRKGTSRVTCYELHRDAKRRLINKCNLLNVELKEIFKRTILRWIKEEETQDKVENLIEANVLLIIQEWLIKSTCEIPL